MAEVWRAEIVEQPLTFATNRLVRIVPADNPADVRGIEDLARPGIAVVLAHPDVPVGAYAWRGLEALGIAGGRRGERGLERPRREGGRRGRLTRGGRTQGSCTPPMSHRRFAHACVSSRYLERASVRAIYPIAIAAQPEHPTARGAFLAIVRSRPAARSSPSTDSDLREGPPNPHRSAAIAAVFFALPLVGLMAAAPWSSFGSTLLSPRAASAVGTPGAADARSCWAWALPCPSHG